MKLSRKIYFFIGAAVLIIAGIIFFKLQKNTATKIPSETQTPANQTENFPTQQTLKTTTPEPTQISFVGPRGNVPDGAPQDYGFWSLAIPVPNVLSRSGQPTLKDFQWLKDNGWKSDIDLRIDGDHAPEVSDDALIPGFKDLGFNYLKIQMLDGAAPTDAQAEQFLSFATKPENQPAHVHCRGGIGRAGIMVALYRYAVQGWPVDKILEESKLYQGGIDETQQKFLENYAATHAPGSFGK
jgi:protein tyrosine phosphatase (PTP) superfamily phosphohydrolase (DUF442 family)